jgi:hypothetical protein
MQTCRHNIEFVDLEIAEELVKRGLYYDDPNDDVVLLVVLSFSLFALIAKDITVGW